MSDDQVVWTGIDSNLRVTQVLFNLQHLEYHGKSITERFSDSVDKNEIGKWVKKKIKSRIKSQTAYYAKTDKLLREIGEELDMWIKLYEN